MNINSIITKLFTVFMSTLFFIGLFSCSKTSLPQELELKDFIINLSEPGENRYLKVKIKLEVENNKVVSEFNVKEAILRDNIITFLSSRKIADLTTTMGKKVLKRQLLDIFNNKLLKEGDVLNIYFVDFVIQ